MRLLTNKQLKEMMIKQEIEACKEIVSNIAAKIYSLELKLLNNNIDKKET